MKNKFLLFGLILANLGVNNLWGAKTQQTIYEMIETLANMKGGKKKSTAINVYVAQINAQITDKIKAESPSIIKTQLTKVSNNAVNLLITNFIGTGKPRFMNVFITLTTALDKCNDKEFDEFLKHTYIYTALLEAITDIHKKGSRVKAIIEQLIQLSKADRIFNKLELLAKDDLANTLLIEVIKTKKSEYLINMLMKEITNALLDHSRSLAAAIKDVNFEMLPHLHEILSKIPSPTLKTEAPEFINEVYLPLQSSITDPQNWSDTNGNTIAYILATKIATTTQAGAKVLLTSLKAAFIELVKKAPLILTKANNKGEIPLLIIKTDSDLIQKIKAALPPTFNSPELANLLAQFIVIEPSDTKLKSSFESIRNSNPELLTSKTGTQQSALAILASYQHQDLKELTTQTINAIKDNTVVSQAAAQTLLEALAAAPTNKGLIAAVTHIAANAPELLVSKGNHSPLAALAKSKVTGAGKALTDVVGAMTQTVDSRKQLVAVLSEAKSEGDTSTAVQELVKNLIAKSPESEKIPLAQTVADAIAKNTDIQSATNPLIGWAEDFVKTKSDETKGYLGVISEDGLVKKYGEAADAKSIIDVLVAGITTPEVLKLLKEMVTKVLTKAQSDGKDLSSKEKVAEFLGLTAIPSELTTIDGSWKGIQPFIDQAVASNELRGKLTQLKTHLTQLKSKLQMLGGKLTILHGKL